MRWSLTEHPAAVGETYLQHMGIALRFSARLVLAGLACLAHGLLPFLFTRTGSSTVSALYPEMVAHRDRRPARPAGSGAKDSEKRIESIARCEVHLFLSGPRHSEKVTAPENNRLAASLS